MEELERALQRLHTPLIGLASAGVLAEMAFSLQDEQGAYGVAVTFKSYAVEEFEEAELSRLALVANPESKGSLEIICLEHALVASIVGEDFPSALSSTALQVTLMSRSADEEAMLSDLEEESDEYDDEYEDEGQPT